METEEVKQLPIEEKMRLMEILWQDMRDRFDQVDLSNEQTALLDARRERVRSGEVAMLDWDAVKDYINKRWSPRGHWLLATDGWLLKRPQDSPQRTCPKPSLGT